MKWGSNIHLTEQWEDKGCYHLPCILGKLLAIAQTEGTHELNHCFRRNAGIYSCEPVITVFSSAGQIHTLLSVYFCLKIPISLIHNIKLVANSNITHACMNFVYHTYFLPMGHGTPLALCLGSILKSKVTNNKAQKRENVSLSKPQKMLVCSINQQRRLAPC
jgi:hypothetical protein